MEQSFTGWLAIRDELTSTLYGIIRNLLRPQFTFRHDEVDDLFTIIAFSLTDSTQSDKLVIYFLSFLHLMPILDKERYGSPFDGVILKILRSRWDTNCLNPGVWAKGHSQRMRMRTVGEELNSGESAQLSQLDGSNDPLCGLVSPRPPGWGEEGQLLSNRERLTTRPVCQQHEQLELLWHSYYTQLHGLFTRRSHHLRKLRPRPVSVMFGGEDKQNDLGGQRDT